MRVLKGVLIAVSLAAMAAPAYADCVDYSEARAKKAAAALAAKPPSAAQLGLPSLDGLVLDARRTTGDPECDGPIDDYFFTSDVSEADFITRLYPYIRRETSIDGMNREWYRNPRGSNGFFLTSGVQLDPDVSDGIITRVRVIPPKAVLPLTEEKQPYSIQNIIDERPWPGDSKEFVQVGSSFTTAAATAASTPASDPAAATEEVTECVDETGSAAGSAIGQELGGRLLGGGAGRSLGGAVGGLFGGGKKKSEDAAKGC